MASHKFKVPRLERRLGRYELMSWMNSFLRIDYTKVEEFSDGIAYCQVVDALLPGSVPLHKLAFHPRNRQDKIRNLKILDRVLAKEKLSKQLDVHALSSGNFQENNEMLQWCYALVQRNCPHVVQTYKALEKRVVAMKRQKYQSAAPVSSSLNAITNRLIPSEVGMSLRFGDPDQEEDGYRADDPGLEYDGGEEVAGEAIREAEIALRRAKIAPGPQHPSTSLQGGHTTEDSHFPRRSLRGSFERSAGAKGLTEGQEGGERARELGRIEDVLLEIEETLVLRLKAFEKLRGKVEVERQRKDFFLAKLVSLEQLCELMPYSAKSETCKKILLGR